MSAAFIGIADTLYLAYYHIIGATPGCAILNGCELVLNSKYAKLFDVPLAYLGLVFYVYLLALVILLAIDPTSRALRFGIVAYTAVGLLCSITFELMQVFLIGALCMYCAISALTTLVLFGLALWHVRATRTLPAN